MLLIYLFVKYIRFEFYNKTERSLQVQIKNFHFEIKTNRVLHKKCKKILS